VVSVEFDEIIDMYRKLNKRNKFFVEILSYLFVASQTENKSNIKISKSRVCNTDGRKKSIRYEIEVPVYD